MKRESPTKNKRELDCSADRGVEKEANKRLNVLIFQVLALESSCGKGPLSNPTIRLPLAGLTQISRYTKNKSNSANTVAKLVSNLSRG